MHTARLRALAAPLLAPLIASAGFAQTPLAVTGIPANAPYTVTATATEAVLLVDLELQREWHAYARDIGGGRPVQLTLAADGDFAATAPLALPPSTDGVLAGHVRLRLPLEPTAESAPRTLAATLELQVCDALECLAPTTLEISGALEPLDVLLVVAERDARAERIAAWLRARGFVASVAAYGDVTAAACEGADVVVADSQVFGKHGVGASVIQRFPRTSTPIVAVGFNGTQLVKAHGLAMTSGYI